MAPIERDREAKSGDLGTVTSRGLKALAAGAGGGTETALARLETEEERVAAKRRELESVEAGAARERPWVAG